MALACCEECHMALMYEYTRLREDFRQATIYVRKVTEDHNINEINQSFTEVRNQISQRWGLKNYFIYDVLLFLIISNRLLCFRVSLPIKTHEIPIFQ